ncbi:hypothetical protein GA0116948_11386 [Chitinophaga costaii]|uniref:Uncharacterized protein n=1 Tax=Chitinophaga costaii TaxID=1335309 RepID=A0A1C4FDF6_9BACT|nr:hypothetical protein [Chitinophaga costaii]PUZ20668.1 hypothetical protein DCM91_18045 [Chitinophaga costaii]SCC53892.1 hypothetical protein GA0116948_11386 [Chitinophaga costaii]
MSSTSNNPFKPDAGSFISHATAHDLVNNYTKQNASQKQTLTRAFFFGAEKVQELLNISGAVGIRVYYGLQANPDLAQPYTKRLVLTAVDKEGYDIHGNPMDAPDPKAAVAKTISAAFLDDGVPCPDHCPPSKPPTTVL